MSTPTYDSRKDAYQYCISTAVNGKSINDRRDLADPFVNHYVRVSLLDTLKGLLKGGVTVTVMVNGKNNRIVEDIMELDDNYLGAPASKRRRDFNGHIEQAALDHVTREMGEA